MVVNLSMLVFWVNNTNVSEEHTASIFRAEVRVKKRMVHVGLGGGRGQG
jgi:hypothetical protein